MIITNFLEAYNNNSSIMFNFNFFTVSSSTQNSIDLSWQELFIDDLVKINLNKNEIDVNIDGIAEKYSGYNNGRVNYALRMFALNRQIEITLLKTQKINTSNYIISRIIDSELHNLFISYDFSIKNCVIFWDNSNFSIIQDAVYDPILNEWTMLVDSISNQSILKNGSNYKIEFQLLPDSFGEVYIDNVDYEWDVKGYFNLKLQPGVQISDSVSQFSWKKMKEISGDTTEAFNKKIYDQIDTWFYENIDISNPAQTFKFSSPTKRLTVFWDKLSELESIDGTILTTSQFNDSQFNVSGNINYDIMSVNTKVNQDRKYEILSSFDQLEKYLYYASSSIWENTDDGWRIEPFPKSNLQYPFTNYSVTSQQAIDWYVTTFDSCSNFEEHSNWENTFYLMPIAMQEDENNTDMKNLYQFAGTFWDSITTYKNSSIYNKWSPFINPFDGIQRDKIELNLLDVGWKLGSYWFKESIQNWNINSGSIIGGSTPVDRIQQNIQNNNPEYFNNEEWSPSMISDIRLWFKL